MSKSKIAIVIAPSIELSKEVMGQVYSTIHEADGIAFVVPHLTPVTSIADILNAMDGILLFSPEQFAPTERFQFQEFFIRCLGRAAVSECTNPVMMVGGRDFYGTDGDWRDMAQFGGGTPQFAHPEFGARFFEQLRGFVQSASTRAAFMRLGNATRKTVPTGLRSAVTHS